MSALVSAAGAATLRHCARRALPKSLAAHAMAAARTVHSKPCEAPARGGRGAKQQAMGNGAGLFLMGGVAAGAATIAAATLAVEQEDRNPALTAEAYSIPIGRAFPGVCNCFIEVSRESRMKYEWDEETNMLKLDRVLHGAAFYPHDYGFIPQTLCGDGDPLDVLVLGTSALQPGAIVDIRPLGYMVMEDEKGLDEKVLAVPDKDPRFNHMSSLRDVPEHVLREITNFFETYKQLEKSKWVKVGGWKGTMDTHDLIENTHKTFVAAKKQAARKGNR